jgi:hypothetical protein
MDAAGHTTKGSGIEAYAKAWFGVIVEWAKGFLPFAPAG